MIQSPALSPLEAAKIALKVPGYCYVSQKFVAIAMDDKTAIIIPGDFSDVKDDDEAVNLKIQELIESLY